MTSILFWDSAYPPEPQPPGDGLAFYAGGDTPHVWTLAEVLRYKVQYHLPIWVRSDPLSVNAMQDAAAFASQLRVTYAAPKGVLVALDSETSVDEVYVRAFVGAMNAYGWPVIDYGSRSTIFGNSNPDGYYWAADWTGAPHGVPDTVAVQYRSLQAYDQDDFESTLPLWGKPVAPPPSKPQEESKFLFELANQPVTIPFPAGKFSGVGLALDNLGNPPYPIGIRLAFHRKSTDAYEVRQVSIPDGNPVFMPMPANDVDCISASVTTILGEHMPAATLY